MRFDKRSFTIKIRIFVFWFFLPIINLFLINISQWIYLYIYQLIWLVEYGKKIKKIRELKKYIQRRNWNYFSYEFMRIHTNSRESLRIHMNSRLEFARIHENYQFFMRIRSGHNSDFFRVFSWIFGYFWNFLKKSIFSLRFHLFVNSREFVRKIVPVPALYICEIRC